MKSKKYTLNTNDLKSLGVGLLVTLAGAILTFLADNLGNVEFGEYTPFIVPVAALAINTLRKLLLGK